MKYVLELELTEISDILGLTVGAVKMRLLRAREEFRKVYDQQIPSEGVGCDAQGAR
jgi:DNA-directed RNA polymerase specialized sigma24 family protein